MQHDVACGQLIKFILVVYRWWNIMNNYSVIRQNLHLFADLICCFFSSRHNDRLRVANDAKVAKAID